MPAGIPTVTFTAAHIARDITAVRIIQIIWPITDIIQGQVIMLPIAGVVFIHREISATQRTQGIPDQARLQNMLDPGDPVQTVQTGIPGQLFIPVHRKEKLREVLPRREPGRFQPFQIPGTEQVRHPLSRIP